MNPIIKKEVLFALRTKKAVAMQVAFLLVMAALLWLLWPADGIQDLGGQKVRELLMVLSIGELTLVILIAPAFTSTAITIERDRNTLESLLATPMSPLSIAVGKMAGALTFLLLLVLSGVPVLASLLLLGGVEIREVLAIIAVLLLSAIHMGAIGLLVSVFSSRSYRSIVVTYCILLAVVFGMAAPAWPVSGTLIRRGAPWISGIIHVLVSMSPLEAMLSILTPNGPYAIGAKDWPAYWVLYIPMGIMTTVIVAAILLRELNRSLLPARPREGLKVVERGHLTGRSVLYLFFFDPRKRKKNIAWWQNPVLMKECRTRRTLQMNWLARATAVCLIISILLMFVVSASVQVFSPEGGDTVTNIATAIGALMVTLIILVGPAMTSGAICSDRESGLWDLMRSSPLPSWRIVIGKFEASLIPLILLIIGTAPALVILLFFQVAMLPNIVRILQVVGVTGLFVTALGMFFSGTCSKTSTATVWTYGVVSAMSLLTMLALLGGGVFGPRFIEMVFVVNPIAAVMSAAGHPTMQNFNLLRPFLQIMAIASGTLFVLTIARVYQLERADG